MDHRTDAITPAERVLVHEVRRHLTEPLTPEELDRSVRRFAADLLRVEPDAGVRAGAQHVSIRRMRAEP